MVNDDFNEWEYFLHKRNSYKEIKYEEVFNENSQLVMISGPKGIGKTHFLQNCLYDWANGSHWKNFNFVFYFEFNKINKLKDVSSLKQLIMKFYKNILNGFEISSYKAIMYIIDGLEEFVYLEQLINPKFPNKIPIIKTLSDAFSSNNCKCVVSGNILSALRFWSTYKHYKGSANLMIVGLSVNGIKCLVENFLFSKALINDLEILSASSRRRAVLLSVPFYLKTVCSTSLKLNVRSLKTMTELQTLIFLHFLHQSCVNKKPLRQIIQTNKQHILKVCEVAFNLLDRGKVNLSQKYLRSVLDENGVEPLGLIKKCVLYQRYKFVHLFSMKFCASIHLLFNANCQKIINNKRLRNCLPTISGFVYCNKQSFLNLISQLEQPLQKSTSWLRDICCGK